MAKLSAHGRTEIGTIHTVTGAKRYMSDGTILKNNGAGWKVHGKVKPGFSPQEVFSKAKTRRAMQLKQNPCFAAYLKALINLAGVSKRCKLHLAVTLMPEDCDGVWSEACDGYGDNIHADIDEISELCRLYLSAMSEKNLATIAA